MLHKSERSKHVEYAWACIRAKKSCIFRRGIFVVSMYPHVSTNHANYSRCSSVALTCRGQSWRPQSTPNGRPHMLTTDGATADTVGRAETFKGNIICSRNGTRELRHSTQINRNEHASSDIRRNLHRHQKWARELRHSTQINKNEHGSWDIRRNLHLQGKEKEIYEKTADPNHMRNQ